MKIRVSFDKSKSPYTEARLTVTRAGSFPDRKIFRGPTDYPTQVSYNLASHKTNTISKHFRDPIRAKLWAEEQLEAIRVRLDSWYNRLSLEDYEVHL